MRIKIFILSPTPKYTQIAYSPCIPTHFAILVVVTFSLFLLEAPWSSSSLALHRKKYVIFWQPKDKFSLSNHLTKTYGIEISHWNIHCSSSAPHLIIFIWGSLVTELLLLMDMPRAQLLQLHSLLNTSHSIGD